MRYLSIFLLNSLLIYFSIAQQCEQISDRDRFDCYPEAGASQDKCQQRNCCWKQADSLDDVNVPYCYYPKDFPAYDLEKIEETEFGLRIRINKSLTGYMPNERNDLTVDVVYETNQRLRIRIYSSFEKRFEVPLPVPVIEKKAIETDYDVNIQQKPFWIVIKRKSNGMILFDSSVSPLIFADQFIKFSTRLSSPLVYGLGEHRQGLLMNMTNSWKKLTFWSRDFPPVENTNLYGVHPFLINPEFAQNQSVQFHGQFFLNSNAMDVDLQPLPAITYTTIGGIIDFYLFTGPTVQNVIEQYWDVIGKPIMPPYWSLGFHLCRYGYNTIDNLIDVIRKMDAADFPYDVQWTDIDVMSSGLDYTYDEKNFASLPLLIRQLQANGKHYVNIIDPGISSIQTSGSYFPFDEGVKQGIFIRKFNSSEYIIGKVWPGLTAFPDFTHPNATQWWTESASKFHEIIPFDGMWIDMNEPSNFFDGSTDGCTDNSLDNPPFTPNVLGGQLNSQTICPSAEQYLSSHYNLHNMFGYFEAQASNAAMKTIRQKRPFVLSRSTFAGSGKYTAHWTGDNRATFDDMYYSIPAILNFNMFGIPHVGADICGFLLDTNEELCTKWMQLGAFYPFMRNHNSIGQKDQDPASFSWQSQQIMKNALHMRYSLIPFWYTLHYQASTFSTTIVQPLFFEFPEDEITYSIDQQFLIGRTLLISPNLKSGTDLVRAYIPSDVWYEFPSGIKLTTTGTFIDLDTPITKFNVHIRGGFIIPMKIPGENLILGRANPFILFVAPSQLNTAHGNLFWDDGDSIELNEYNYLEFSLQNNLITIETLRRNSTGSTMNLEIIKILDVKQQVTQVKINGQIYTKFLYNVLDQILLIYELDLNMISTSNQTIQWIY